MGEGVAEGGQAPHPAARLDAEFPVRAYPRAVSSVDGALVIAPGRRPGGPAKHWIKAQIRVARGQPSDRFVVIGQREQVVGPYRPNQADADLGHQPANDQARQRNAG